MTETSSGVLTHIRDTGTVVQLGVSVGRVLRWLAADGNLYRRAEADFVASHPNALSLLGVAITFEQNHWGGMESFSVITQEQAP